MKVTRIFIVVVLFASALHTHAQNRLVIHEDTRVQLLRNLKDSIIVCFHLNTVIGYRILVSPIKNQDTAYHLKRILQERYTGYSVYMSYQTPYFKIKLGDFLSKEMAETFNAGLSRNIKIATTVISDKIYKPNLQEAKEPLCPESWPLPMYVKALTKKL